MSHHKKPFAEQLMFGVSVIFILLALFFMSRQNNDNQLNTPSSPVSQDTTAGLVMTPEGWNLFSNSQLGVTVTYPENTEFSMNGGSSVTFTPVNSSMSPEFLYISVVPLDEDVEAGEIYNYSPSNYQLLQNLGVGESGAEPRHDPVESFTYTRLSDEMIVGETAKVFENVKPHEFPENTTEKRYLMEKNGKLYIIGYYINSADSNSFTQETVSQMVNSFYVLDSDAVML